MESDYMRRLWRKGNLKIEIEVQPIKAGEMSNDKPRLLFCGPIWSEWDLQFCVHGEKLGWQCDYCDEYFTKSNAN